MTYANITIDDQTYAFHMDMVNAKGYHLVFFRNVDRPENHIIKIDVDGKLVDFDFVERMYELYSGGK